MQAAGPHWRRTSTGLYLPVGVDGSPVDQRIVEVAAGLPTRAFISGWAALRWFGATWFSGVRRDGAPRDIWVDLWDGGMRPRDGVRITEEALDFPWVTQRDGVRLTTALWATLVEMRFAVNLREAVIAFDMAAYADLVSIAEVAELAARLNARTGIPLARKAIPYLEENSWSPQESRTRMVWRVDAGLPPPLCNRPVFDPAGRHIATPDLLEPETGVAVDYDGADHLSRARRYADEQRAELMRDYGLEYLIVQADDHVRVERLVQRMRNAYERGRRVRRQTWTITPPYWWTSTATVAQRRALAPELQARLLAYRRTA